MTLHLSLDLPPALVARLESLAETNTATIEKIAAMLLAQALDDQMYWVTGEEGLPLYIGPTQGIDLDHRTVREERIEHLTRGILRESDGEP